MEKLINYLVSLFSLFIFSGGVKFSELTRKEGEIAMSFLYKMLVLEHNQ